MISIIKKKKEFAVGMTEAGLMIKWREVFLLHENDVIFVLKVIDFSSTSK